MKYPNIDKNIKSGFKFTFGKSENTRWSASIAGGIPYRSITCFGETRQEAKDNLEYTIKMWGEA